MNRFLAILLFSSAITIHAEESAPVRAFVVGRVVLPGEYALKEKEQDLYHLILKAGGLTDGVACGGLVVTIFRPTDENENHIERHRVDVAKLMEIGASSDLNRDIRDSDTVAVHAVGF